MKMSRLNFVGGFVSGALAAAATRLFYDQVSLKEDPQNTKRRKEILKHGIPDQKTQVRFHSNLVLVYDQQWKIPLWVAEHLTADNLKGSETRRNVKFKPDPSIDTIFSAQNTDYMHSGWSRGHMAPAGDNKGSKTDMEESFYLSNILPQNLENNAGFWNRLEMYCRDLTEKFSSVRVLSGPLMMPLVEENGKNFVKYQVIGENQVAVPTHLYKVIVTETPGGQPPAVGAFIVPNQPIGFEHPLKEYQVDLTELERKAGIRLTPDLDRTKTRDLCLLEGCKLLGKDEFDLYIIGRKLAGARTRHRLEVVWRELEERKLKPDKYLLDLYGRKREELASKDRPQT